jgi:preprotein translocase subunit SecF
MTERWLSIASDIAEKLTTMSWMFLAVALVTFLLYVPTRKRPFLLFGAVATVYAIAPLLIWLVRGGWRLVG